jgi:hypothetical protein
VAKRDPMNAGDPMKRQCTAHSRGGTRCKRAPIPGGTVCRMHGGAAPQVQATAKERLAALVDPALGVVGKALKSYDERVSLIAAKDVLDRNGLKSPEKHELTGRGGAPIQVEHSGAALAKFMTDAELDAAEAFALELQARSMAAKLES